jgi:prevent-host-death family protein
MVISWHEMTMSAWSIADAKARFALLVSDSRKHPQRITRRGKPVAVVLGIDEYEELTQALARQAAHPMRDFLDASRRLRARGDIEIELPRRTKGRARPDPFRGKR